LRISNCGRVAVLKSVCHQDSTADHLQPTAYYWAQKCALTRRQRDNVEVTGRVKDTSAIGQHLPDANIAWIGWEKSNNIRTQRGRKTRLYRCMQFGRVLAIL